MNSHKILAIQASPRKKTTQKLLELVSGYLEREGSEIEIIQLENYEISSCSGCQNCIYGKPCHQKDSANLLKRKLISADAVIIAAPVFMASIPGNLKNFIDRTADWFHRPELIGKPMLTLVTAAGSYAAYTGRYLNTIGMHWGCAAAGAFTRTAWQKTDMKAILKSRAVRRFNNLIIRGSQTHHISWRNLYLFNLQKILARNILDVDKKFWYEKGWMDSPFFFSARISPTKRLGMFLLYSFLIRVITRSENENENT